MAATTSGLWICADCGKVCKSRGGLTQHSSSHRRGLRIGELRDDSSRVYHPSLDGMFSSSSSSTSSNPLKGDRVAQMESFFHLDRFQLPHPQGLRTIGPRLYRAPDLKSRNSCIQRHLSQTTLSTIFSTSGPLRLLLTVPLHQYSTTVTFTRRSMRSDLDTYPGVHILSNTTVSALKTHPSRNG